MNAGKTLLAASLGLCLIGPVCAGSVMLEEPEVRTIVTDAGFGDPVRIERDGRLWRVEAPGTDSDDEITLFVDEDGKILGAADVAEARISALETPEVPPEPVTLETVALVIRDAGFHDVHDIDFLHSENVWKAEADDFQGEDYELHVDPDTGRIVHIEDD